MAEFSVKDKKKLNTAADSINRKVADISSVYSTVSSISNNLAYQGAAYNSIRSSLNSIMTNLDEEKRSMKSLGDALDSIADMYGNTESKIVANAVISPIFYSVTNGIDNISLGVSKAKDIFENGLESEISNKILNAYKNGQLSISNGLFEIYESGKSLFTETETERGYSFSKDGAEVFVKTSATAGLATGEFSIDTIFGKLSANGSLGYAGANAEAKAYAQDGDVAAEAAAGVELGLAKGEVECDGLWGLSKYKAAGEVLSAAANTTLSYKLFQDSKFNLEFSASAEASASAAKGNIEKSIGTDNYKVSVEAAGEVLSASANAEANFSSDSIKASAGAEAYLAKGEVEGGFTIAGIDISAKVGGGVGVEASAEFEASGSSITVSAGFAAILGVEGEITIDWSDIDFSLW